MGVWVNAQIGGWMGERLRELTQLRIEGYEWWRG